MSGDGKVEVHITLRLRPEVAAWLRDEGAAHGNTPDVEMVHLLTHWSACHAAAMTRCPGGHTALLDHRIHARYAMGDTVPVTCRACAITYLRNLAAGTWLRIPEAA